MGTLEPSMFTLNERNGLEIDPKISILLIDDRLFIRECIIQSLLKVAHDVEFTTYNSINDFSDTSCSYDIVLYHSYISMLNNKNLDDLKRTVPRLATIAPVIILSASVSQEAVITAVELGARGFISTVTTGSYLMIEIIRMIRAGGTFVPAQSLSMRRYEQGRVTGQSISTQHFSPRQMAVLECLKFGKANKVIAYDLDMAENTVKVHVRNIMKKLGVTNRTEAVYRAFHLENAGETKVNSVHGVTETP